LANRVSSKTKSYKKFLHLSFTSTTQMFSLPIFFTRHNSPCTNIFAPTGLYCSDCPFRLTVDLDGFIKVNVLHILDFAVTCCPRNQQTGTNIAFFKCAISGLRHFQSPCPVLMQRQMENGRSLLNKPKSSDNSLSCPTFSREE